MAGKISVVINTLNEAKSLKIALESLKWADEILVCDMHSEDGSDMVAKSFGANVVYHKKEEFVELARNFAISRAANEWILILDPDEEVPEILAKKLIEIVERPISADFVEIPRKNIIFGKWVKASMWWPDYNIRFFRKGCLQWGSEIHRPPKTTGHGLKLEAMEELAIIHHHYNSVAQFISRMNRYSDVQASELFKSGYKFDWSDLVHKPLGEFLSRFFANRGYSDGLHGLTLSLLQAFSFLVVYLKVWEMEKFREQEVTVREIKQITKESGYEINYWLKYGNLSSNPLKRFIQRAKNKLL